MAANPTPCFKVASLCTILSRSPRGSRRRKSSHSTTGYQRRQSMMRGYWRMRKLCSTCSIASLNAAINLRSRGTSLKKFRCRLSSSARRKLKSVSALSAPSTNSWRIARRRTRDDHKRLMAKVALILAFTQVLITIERRLQDRVQDRVSNNTVANMFKATITATPPNQANRMQEEEGMEIHARIITL